MNKLATATIKETEEIYLLNPSLWNPHDYSYAGNEENMLDWEVNMIKKRHRTQMMLCGIEVDAMMTASIKVSTVKSNAIDNIHQRSNNYL